MVQSRSTTLSLVFSTTSHLFIIFEVKKYHVLLLKPELKNKICVHFHGFTMYILGNISLDFLNKINIANKIVFNIHPFQFTALVDAETVPKLMEQ